MKLKYEIEQNGRLVAHFLGGDFAIETCGSELFKATYRPFQQGAKWISSAPCSLAEADKFLSSAAKDLLWAMANEDKIADYLSDFGTPRNDPA